MQRLTFNNAIFDALRVRMDEALQNLMSDMNKASSDEGSMTISIKVKFAATEDYEDSGEVKPATSPIFTSRVSTAISLKSTPITETCGDYDKILEFEDKEWVIKGKNSNQHSFFDGGEQI